MRSLLASLLFVGCVPLSFGCATLVGTVTGPATSAVGVPLFFMEDSDPEWDWLAVVLGVPTGIVFGPLFGFAKGISIDVRGGLGDDFDYSDGWNLSEHSIWRPLN
jgi:hypothetical protein